MSYRIIVDVMGSDSGCEAVIRGAVDGAALSGSSLLLVGDREIINKELGKIDVSGLDIETEHTPVVMEMSDPPGMVMKEKSDSSMALAVRLLKEGRGDALISCGNTGALFTCSSLVVRRVHGARRALLAAVVPLENAFVICDAGANIDATPEMLVQFAAMGSIYAHIMLGYDRPRVALLNNGSEENKGTEQLQKAHALLRGTRLNFIGNCEGRDLPADFCDVAVCDGFTGNNALKTIEGMGKLVGVLLNRIFRKSIFTKIGYLLTKRSVDSVRKQLDHTEYGGAPFLGLSKVVIKAHGSAGEKSVMRAVLQAVSCCEKGLVDRIEEELSLLKRGAENE